MLQRTRDLISEMIDSRQQFNARESKGIIGALQEQVDNIKKELEFKKDDGIYIMQVTSIWGGSKPETIANRIEGLEDKMDMLLDHLKLEVKTRKEKTYLGKKK